MLHEKSNTMLVIVLVGLMCSVLVLEAAAQAPQPAPSKGLTAMDRAAKANNYLFVFIFRQDDEETRTLRQVFDDAVNALSGKADSVVVSVTDPSEAEMVTKFRISKASTPLVLVLAPNGAVTGGFPGNFTKEQLLSAFVTPTMEQLLGAVQQGKLVVLCVQNGKTRGNSEAMNGVRALKADKMYGPVSEIVMMDPGQPSERPFLAKLGIDKPIEEATTILVMPPGSVIGSFKGATDKNQLVATLTTALSRFGGACKPGQCGVGN
jgi:hypothetical protein